jgi:hypothetical protein
MCRNVYQNLMRVLVACEFSGIVRDAFAQLGHDSWSCDLLETERPGQHIVGDVLEVMTRGWDLMVAHPPCTALCRAGDRWYRQSPARQEAVAFVQQLYDAPVPRIAIENPRGLNRFWRQADQTIQPWMFGHGETKASLLWLRNLPPLMATNVSTGRTPRVFWAQPGPNRWKERSRTLEGVAAAMADQWGAALELAA